MMKRKKRQETGAAIIAYMIIALVVMGTLATISSYVISNLHLSARRQDMINAYQYAQGGAALACRDVEIAFTSTNKSGFAANLTGSATAAYAKDGTLSTGGNWVYTRAITSPFTNQTVNLEVWTTNSSSPTWMVVRSKATVGNSTQTVQANLEAAFSSGAAIISTAAGTDTSDSGKGAAQKGNVSVSGSKGTTYINGGILANGSANTNDCIVKGSISEMLKLTESKIPDYTQPGSDQQLFDFARFTKVADLMGTHYTNLTSFVAAAKPGTNLEGVIVVDIPKGSKDLDSGSLPNGINVIGTLVFKFSAGWTPADKLKNLVSLNINAADLSGLVPTDPATYTTGYPPTFSSPSRNPATWDISPYGFDNFTATDDFPALMYNNAILDIHGPANVCGVVYSPAFMEIENKGSDQIQYFRGSLIGGGGIYVENNNNKNASIVTFDSTTLDLLATYDGRGKGVKLVYQK